MPLIEVILTDDLSHWHVLLTLNAERMQQAMESNAAIARLTHDVYPRYPFNQVPVEEPFTCRVRYAPLVWDFERQLIPVQVRIHHADVQSQLVSNRLSRETFLNVQPFKRLTVHRRRLWVTRDRKLAEQSVQR